VDEARGGVLILCKDNLNPSLFKEAEVDSEILWITIDPHPRVSYLIGGCYRPERDEVNNIKKIIDSISKINTTKVILTGDFNFQKY
jgi:hypothetical protein